MPYKPIHQSPEYFKTPNPIKHFLGGLFIFVSSVGLILTAPLIFLSGIISLIAALVLKRDVLQVGFIGLRMGSIGFLDIMLLGIKRIKMLPPEEAIPDSSLEKIPEDINPDHTTPNTFFPRPVKEAYIIKLVQITQNPLLPKSEFWDRLDQMTVENIALFVNKLSINIKDTIGKSKISPLDHLWNRFQPFEYESTKRNNKMFLFSKMLEALSEEQLEASLSSSIFLNVLEQDAFAEAAANTFTSEQLVLFASDKTRHKVLGIMIEKIKPDASLPGKLQALIPYVTLKLQTPLMHQIAHLDNTEYKVSSKCKIINLLESHLAKNMSEPSILSPTSKV